MVLGERAEGKQEVAQLAGAVHEAGHVATGCPVAERQLDLFDLEPGLQRIQGHARLAAEAGGRREAALTRSRRERPLPGERLAQVATGGQAEELASRALDDPEAAALAFSEHRHGQVGSRSDERPQISAEIRVAEQEASGRSRPLRACECLSFSSARKREHAGAGLLGDACGPVARPVVGHDHLRVRKRLAQRRDRGRDPLLLVTGGDEDGEAIHLRGWGSRAGLRRPRSS